MSYINQDFKMQKRRHSIRKVTPEEAIKVANEVVDKANDQIARSLSHANAWQQVATDLYQENERLNEQTTQQAELIKTLEAEIERLRRKVSRKSGKHKGEEWEE